MKYGIDHQKLKELKRDLIKESKRQANRLWHYIRIHEDAKQRAWYLLTADISSEELRAVFQTAYLARLHLDQYLRSLRDFLTYLYGTEYTEGWTWKL